MSARPIGDILKPIIARAAAMHGFQKMINDIPEASSRKEFILVARMGGLISVEEADLLIQVYQLEAA